MFPIPFNFPFRKKDGSITTMDDAISGGGTPYTLPTASAEIKGGIKIGSGLSMSGETLNNSNPTPYSLPTASDETLGGVKVGSGLSIDENGVLSTSGGGGSSVVYEDYDITNGSINATSWNSFSFTPTNAMIGKHPIGGQVIDAGLTPNYNGQATVLAGLAWHNNVVSATPEGILAVIYNNHSSSITVRKIRVFYV